MVPYTSFRGGDNEPFRRSTIILSISLSAPSHRWMKAVIPTLKQRSPSCCSLTCAPLAILHSFWSSRRTFFGVASHDQQWFRIINTIVASNWLCIYTCLRSVPVLPAWCSRGSPRFNTLPSFVDGCPWVKKNTRRIQGGPWKAVTIQSLNQSKWLSLFL